MSKKIERWSDFYLEDIKDIKEYNSKAKFYKHKSGLEVFHLLNKREENLFAIAFKTIPENESGIAHILEHTVLCGSKNYNVKDPFLYLIKSSLNTFLNAFTFPDKTVYPASSTVEEDYFNLFKVYCDALFQPLLKKEAFMQEGHNLNINSREVSGTVFNEMKGAYSNNNSIINEYSTSSLFSNKPYIYDSGGKPSSIIDLSYEEFINFYKKYYRLDNCYIFLFGNIETEKQLDFIEKNIINVAKKNNEKKSFTIPLENRWSSPKYIEKKIIKSTNNKLNIYLINWLCAQTENSEDIIGLEILSDILLNDSSPLIQKVLKSKIGEDIYSGSGIETELRESIFSFGITGVRENNREKFERLVFKTLEDLSKKIDKDLISGALFNFEFYLKEERERGEGLDAMRKALRAWIHNQHPLKSLETFKYIENIKNKIEKNEPYFENLIFKYLIKNKHFTFINFIPDDNYLDESEKIIREKIDSKINNLKDDMRKKLSEEFNLMLKYKDSEDSESEVKKLPKLKIDSLPKYVEEDTNLELNKELNLYEAKITSNDIFYLDLKFSLSPLSLEDFKYMSLFVRALDSSPTKNLDYINLNNKIQNTFGSIEVKTEFDEDIFGSSLKHLWILIKSFNNKIKDSFYLLREILNNVDFFNLERLEELILELKYDFKDLLSSKGHYLSSTRASSKLNYTQYLKELQSGISARDFWLNIKTDKKSLNEIALKLEEIKNKLFNKAGIQALISSNNKSVCEKLREQFKNLKNSLNDKFQNNNEREEFNKKDLKELLIIPAQISFNSLVFHGFKISDKEYSTSYFISHILKSEKLWNKIRVKGGAYGAFSSIAKGIFALSSYRDPNVINTLNAFIECFEELSSNKINSQMLELYLIGTIGSSLNILSEHERAFLTYKRILFKLSQNRRQEIRNSYFKITSDKIEKTSKFLLESIKREKSICSLVSENTYNKEKKYFSGYKVEIKI